jgi:hypothetical protein
MAVHDRLSQRRDRTGTGINRKVVIGTLALVVADLVELDDIGADRKNLALALEHDRANISRVSQARKHFGPFGPHRQRHGILLRGPVQCDMRNAVPPFDVDLLRPDLLSVQRPNAPPCRQKVVRRSGLCHLHK